MEPESNKTKWKVLLIEDDGVAREVLAAICRNALRGAIVHRERDLASGLERLSEAGPFDLVVLDLNLPDSAGIQTLTRVRRFRGGGPKAPILIVSDIESRETILAAYEAGAAGYVPKAYPAGVIADAVRTVAGGKLFVPPHIRTGAD